MREPPTARDGRGESSSAGAQIRASPGTSERASLSPESTTASSPASVQTETGVPSDSAQTQQSGSSPPRHIDTLVNQLRNQSLRPQHFHRHPASESPNTQSPASTSSHSTNSLNGGHDGGMPIEVDPDEEEMGDTPMPLFVGAGYSRSSRLPSHFRTRNRAIDNIMAMMISSGDQCNVQTLEATSASASAFTEGQSASAQEGIPTDSSNNATDADEGFCEGGDGSKPASSEAAVSMHAASGPTGIRKNRNVQYRTSIDAARRLPNLVHRRVRMRRRDKSRPSPRAESTEEPPVAYTSQ